MRWAGEFRRRFSNVGTASLLAWEFREPYILFLSKLFADEKMRQTLCRLYTPRVIAEAEAAIELIQFSQSTKPLSEDLMEFLIPIRARDMTGARDDKEEYKDAKFDPVFSVLHEHGNLGLVFGEWEFVYGRPEVEEEEVVIAPLPSY
jgi:hypothetical protein